ncbi:sulfatase-like hydrolase/transferase [Pelagibacterium montanilacus]|uniref:sulfatase-like hydrolase/transferase n=1 Tax=Pelagibacterium montanilacus TaxID=2185280 RepID=UPI0019D263B7|nr:sulfatase-like hydrolase/transferase [Pelagibacterium montanilacus]
MMGRLRSGAWLVLAALLLHGVLVLPNHPGAMTPGALLVFPLELPAILFLMLALPARGPATQAARLTIVLALVVVSLLKLADFALTIAFSRTFNPLVDLGLIEAGIRLLAGTLGQPMAALVVLGAILAPIALGAALWWATGVWARLPLPSAGHLASGVAALASLAVVVAEIGQARGVWRLPAQPPGAAFTARVGYERATAYSALFAQMRDFRAQAADDHFADLETPLDRLAGRDVVVIFVESYARASFDNPLYAPTHTATLEAAEPRLADRGLAARSGWLTAPIAGGQSWLAHGTLASGLTVGNQSLYTSMLASERRTLWDFARAAGYDTTAVMPAITMPWPEGETIGFDDIYPADRLGYRGEPFNWVTMPDQYTLAAFDRLRPELGDQMFAQIALISSHAPWVPVPDLVDWSEIGDGTIFNDMALAGDPPAVVWQDEDRIREQYRLSVDYALETVMDYVARHPDSDERLTIIVGDHPATLFVAGVNSFDVPMHVIGPPDLVDSIDQWDWTEGLVPSGALASWPMAEFRDRFLAAYTTPVAGSPL